MKKIKEFFINLWIKFKKKPLEFIGKTVFFTLALIILICSFIPKQDKNKSIAFADIQREYIPFEYTFYDLPLPSTTMTQPRSPAKVISDIPFSTANFDISHQSNSDFTLRFSNLAYSGFNYIPARYQVRIVCAFKDKSPITANGFTRAGVIFGSVKLENNSYNFYESSSPNFTLFFHCPGGTTGATYYISYDFTDELATVHSFVYYQSEFKPCSLYFTFQNYNYENGYAESFYPFVITGLPYSKPIISISSLYFGSSLYNAGYEAANQDGSAYQSGYGAGYQAGLNSNNKYQEGFNAGKAAGRNEALSEGLKNPVGFMLDPVISFFDVKLFGIVSIGSILSIVIFVLVACIFLKMFAGG